MPRVPTAYLFAPAYPLDDASHARALTAATAWCAQAGFTLVPSPLLARRSAVGSWLPAAERRADFHAGLGHDALIAARGGYGARDLLTDWTPPARWPLLIGYSDLTLLHAVWHGPGLYGFMPGVAHGPRAFDSALALARGAGHAVPGRALRHGQATGPLFAACLRVLTSLVGTPWMPKLHGRILALEDIDERPYRLDRDLGQLHAAGCLHGVTALVGGTFPATAPPGYGGPSADDILTTWADRLGIPALGGIPFGHETDPITLAQGRMSQVLVTTTPTLLQEALPCAAHLP